MAAVVGTIGPWVFFGRYLAGGGALVGFVGDIFSNDLGAGAWVDLLVSGTVFMVWSFVDSRRRNLSGWWIHVVALWTVGLSLALPLYLFRRGGTGS